MENEIKIINKKYFSMFYTKGVNDKGDIKIMFFKELIKCLKETNLVRKINIEIDLGKKIIDLFESSEYVKKNNKENCKSLNLIKCNFHLTKKMYNKKNTNLNIIISEHGRLEKSNVSKYRTTLQIIQCNGIKYIEKIIYIDRIPFSTIEIRKIYLKVSKLFIEYIIHSYLAYIYSVPIPFMEYFIYEKFPTETILKARSEYQETTTLNIFFKSSDFTTLTPIKKDNLILEILLQISDYLNLYKIRCKFIHGDLLFNNIMLFYEILDDNIIIKQIKFIDFGSSSINICINKIQYLLCDFSKKSGIEFLDSINNHNFAFSTDLTFLFLQIIYYKDYSNHKSRLINRNNINVSELISEELKNSLCNIFEINFKNLDIILDEFEQYINKETNIKIKNIANNIRRSKSKNESFIQKKLNEQNEIRHLQDKKKSYYSFNILKFLSKIKEYRDNILDEIQRYENFHPLNFRNKILKLRDGNIIPSLIYLEQFGINNIFGLKL